MKKIKCIPVLSFFFACVIVLYHADYIIEAVSDADLAINNFMLTLNGRLAEIALSYFFGVTGFLLFRNMSSLKSCLEKMKRRVSSLLLPYLFWQLLTVVLFLLTRRYRTRAALVGCLKAIFLLQNYPPDIPLWYLYTVFLWTLLSPLLFLLLKNRRLGFALLLLMDIGLFFLMNDPRCKSVSGCGIVWLTLRYTFPYLSGAFYGLHFPDPRDRDSLKYIGFSLIFAYALSSLSLRDFKISVLLAAFPILILKYFPERLCRDKKLYHCSFILMAIHYPIYQLILDQIEGVKITGIPASLVSTLFRFAFLIGTTALSYGILVLLSRFTPRFCKLITGGRA